MEVREKEKDVLSGGYWVIITEQETDIKKEVYEDDDFDTKGRVSYTE